MSQNRQFIAFVNKSNNDVNQLKELYLPCPRSSRRSLYFCNDKGALFEVQNTIASDRWSCWLLDSYAYKDGAVRFITPMDPLLVALPIFQKAFEVDTDRFKTLEEILVRENVKLELAELKEDLTPEKIAQEEAKPLDIHRLNNILGLEEQLAHICEIKEIVPGLFAYKLNEDLALNWLEKKVTRILNSTAFQDLLDKEEQDQNIIKLQAVYTLSDYLNRYWFEKLLDKLHLGEVNARTSIQDITNYVTDASPSSFLKRSNPDNAERGAAKKKKPAVPKSLAKVNTSGMKTLNTFFVKKET